MADNGRTKQLNTDLLRRAMRGGERSKNELARETGLSFPTVSRIVDEMVARGEARETGAAASTGGRCAMQYVLEPGYRVFLCLRLEERTLHWFVCDLAGSALERGQEECAADILSDLDTLLMRVKARYPRLGAVSMGFAGTMKDGVVNEAFCYPGLRGVNLRAHLYNIVGLPVAVLRDMQLVAAGYAARCTPPPRAAVCIYIGGGGIGAGVVLDGRVWEGANGFAGELHFLPIENNMEYAKTHFAGADMADYCARTICACAALINPDSVVLYADPLLDGVVEDVRARCAAVLPTLALPHIALSQEFTTDYETGLITLARRAAEEETE